MTLHKTSWIVLTFIPLRKFYLFLNHGVALKRAGGYPAGRPEDNSHWRGWRPTRAVWSWPAGQLRCQTGSGKVNSRAEDCLLPVVFWPVHVLLSELESPGLLVISEWPHRAPMRCCCHHIVQQSTDAVSQICSISMLKFYIAVSTKNF